MKHGATYDVYNQNVQMCWGTTVIYDRNILQRANRNTGDFTNLLDKKLKVLLVYYQTCSLVFYGSHFCIQPSNLLRSYCKIFTNITLILFLQQIIKGLIPPNPEEPNNNRTSPL